MILPTWQRVLRMLQLPSTKSFEKIDGRSSKSDLEHGLTLIECLVAIAVIASTIGVIAPITILTVATRVQNQRAEQAIHIAQSEIDRVRLTVERGGNFDLSDVASTTLAIDAVPAPNTVDEAAASTTVTAARSVDVNNDGTDDFAIQLFRTYSTAGVSDGIPVAFELGVRVYRAQAIERFAPTNQVGTEQAALTFTDGEGEGTTRPLAVLYTTIVKSDRTESLCDYYRYNSASFDASTTVACQ